MDYTIPLKTRMCGGLAVVSLINGTTTNLYVTNDVQLIKKGGMCIDNCYGDLYVHFNVDYPSLNTMQKEKMAIL